MSGADAALVRVLADEGGADDVLAARADQSRRKKEKRRALIGDRAEFRLALVCVVFILAYGALGVRMATLAASEPAEPRLSTSTPAEQAAGRRAITDRKGRLMAVDLPVYAIYADPKELKAAGETPGSATEKLASVLPGLDAEEVEKNLTNKRRFAWIKRPATPAERQRVHDLGLPGVYFGRRETRVYPAGRMAAHILGGARTGEEDARGAEIVGLAGVERALDETLSDPAHGGAPFRLSIDLSVQAALTEVMDQAIIRYRAKAGALVLMDARNGEIVSLVSLPDFDPNARPNANDPAVKAVRPMMNRAAEGVFELGSTFKLFAAAQALEDGVAEIDTMIDTTGPLKMGRFRIRDFHRMPPQMTLKDVIVESSNTGTARLAMAFGPEAQRAFLDKFGLLAPTRLEIAEARLGAPLLPPRWGQLQSMTISYGHGLATTPLHLAAGYAALVNGGLKVDPTLRAGAPRPGEGARIITRETSADIRTMLRAVVEEGTGRKAAAPGYEVGGKTGTADKPRPGGYHRDKTIATFAAAFPMSAPKYVLIVMLDEPKEKVYGKTVRTAGWTAAPVAGAAIRLAAPLLGLRPRPQPVAGDRSIQTGAGR